MSPYRKTSKMYPITGKTLSTLSQTGRDLETHRPMVETLQGVFSLIVKYENRKKCICRPIAEHVS